MIAQNNSVRAVLRKIRVSPQKLNVVVSMIRGMRTAKALDVLLYSKRRIADDVRKTLLSAVANAENNNGINPGSLFVKEAYVGYSIKLRRFHPRGRGRGGKIMKPFSHLTIVVEERVEA
ncbi:MAG: 50S ribosomal protein L22 [Holosporales bacterium]|jgi:large subunit ribosomal protein L22|nr:50S ribosomal protein L22 [Holosporales bacterium]